MYHFQEHSFLLTSLPSNSNFDSLFFLKENCFGEEGTYFTGEQKLEQGSSDLQYIYPFNPFEIIRV